MKRTTLDVIRIFRSPLDPRRGRLVAGPITAPCALGHAGIVCSKREGDGGTPRGRFEVIAALYRADRVSRPRTGLPLRTIRPNDGWCDDVRDRRYNRPIRLPDLARHERMWREDHLYDVVLDLAVNRRPVIRGRGSAVFFHLAAPNFGPTEGCVAVEPRMAARLLARIGPRTGFVIG